MSVKISKRTLLFGLYGAGTLLLIFTGIVSWDHHNLDTERVFWGTVDQSMKTAGVTVEATQDTGGSSLHQTIQYSMAGQNTAHTVTSLTQAGTAIVNETIGTPTADYTRYNSIKTDQKTASGKPMDFTKVLGVWAKTDHAFGQSQQLPEAVLGTSLPLGGVAMPLAQLQPTERQKLMDQIRADKVYDVSFKDVEKTHKDGRLLYTYTVSVKPDKYAAMMQDFATATGLHDLDALKPEQYAGQQSFVIVMIIDARSHRLVSAQTADASIRQTYSGYDVPAIVAVPTQTIMTTELQKRLQELQQ